MKLKRTISLFVSAVMLLSLVPLFCASAQSSSTSEIPSMVAARADSLQEDILWAKDNNTYSYNVYKGATLSTWAQKYANMAALLSLMPDEVSDYFAEPITRSDFATLTAKYLTTLIGVSSDDLISQFGSKSFSDCDSTAVQICAALGIITGYTDGTFKPNSNITRQEAATMLSRIAMLTGCYANSYNGEFSDDGGLWGENYIGNASKLKDPFMGAAVMNGTGSGMFSPDEYYTREQAIVTIVRLFGATTACHTGYSGTQLSAFLLPQGTYFRTDTKSRLTISYSNGKVLYSLISSDKGTLKGTSESGTISYNAYTKSLKGSESELFFTLQSDFSIAVKTDWLDEMYSAYNVFDGVYGKNSSSSNNSPTPTPSPSVSPSNEDSGDKLPGDDEPTLTLGDSMLPKPIDFISENFGPIANPVNPDKATQILTALKNGKMRFFTGLGTNGTLTVAYKYWGSRAQLSKYASLMLDNADITATDVKINAIVDYFAGGGEIGTKVAATCGKPLIGKGTLSFSNEESAKVYLANSGIAAYIKNISCKYTLDSSLTISALSDKAKVPGSYMMIDPEKRLIICYDYSCSSDGVDWLEDCWIFNVDVDSNGKLVLTGVVGQSVSTGVRTFFKANYTVEVVNT